MKITKISVEGLFGTFNHEIPVKMDEHITIIHGPNGFGKTALLRMVDGLFNMEFAELCKIPFRKFRVDFDEDRYIDVKQKLNEENLITLTVVYPNDNGKFDEFTPIQRSTYHFRESQVIKEMRESGIEVFDPTDAYERVETLTVDGNWIVTSRPRRMRKKRSVPDEFVKLVNTIPIHFIETQRLLAVSNTQYFKEKTKQTSMEPVVAVYSKQLAHAIQSKLAESTAKSQSLDRTLPVRLVERSKATSDLTIDELRNRLSALEDKRERLIEAGLLDQDKNDIDFRVFQMADIEEATKNILSLYIEDVEEKLGFFDEILGKIELLTDIVNNRFLYKKMSISREGGFVFTSANGQPLSPTDLSSGEQHELVLLYDLLFNMKPNSFILIDEPELSLHIAWQKQFLKDLQEVSRLTDSNFLIATHSPQIISNRWDLTVELQGA